MKVRDLIARLSALRVAGLLDEWGEELAGTLERQAARGQGPTERQRFAAVASRAAFSKRGQRSNVFFKDQHAPKRSATICCRSTRRQRTTPCTARSGPVSTTSASCASCSAERRGRWPFDQLSLSPSGPRSLKRCTQSRSVWRSMPPIRAASARLIPSSTAASDSRRRLWLACLEAAASRRSSSVEKSALTVTAVAMARILPRHGISSHREGNRQRVRTEGRWYYLCAALPSRTQRRFRR